jgi:hypothetical protein
MSLHTYCHIAITIGANWILLDLLSLEGLRINFIKAFIPLSRNINPTIISSIYNHKNIFFVPQIITSWRQDSSIISYRDIKKMKEYVDTYSSSHF